jgi:dimethylargininase
VFYEIDFIRSKIQNLREIVFQESISKMSMRYTHAVLCRIPLSLGTRGEVQLEEAKKQHQALAQLLRELGIDVIEMPPDENSPLCVFVEDIAIVCNGIALIAQPNEPSRMKEVSI